MLVRSADAEAQRERVRKLIAESGGKKMECPKCNGRGKFVDSIQNGNFSDMNPYRVGTAEFQNFENSRQSEIFRKCDRCRGEGVIDK